MSFFEMWKGKKRAIFGVLLGGLFSLLIHLIDRIFLNSFILNLKPILSIIIFLSPIIIGFVVGIFLQSKCMKMSNIEEKNKKKKK